MSLLNQIACCEYLQIERGLSSTGASPLTLNIMMGKRLVNDRGERTNWGSEWPLDASISARLLRTLLE